MHEMRQLESKFEIDNFPEAFSMFFFFQKIIHSSPLFADFELASEQFCISGQSEVWNDWDDQVLIRTNKTE